jgi:DNA-binding GntR family transcriptional regulator
LLRERARAAIRDAIAAGRLRPGQQIVETTIGAEIGASRVPVREALRELERDGVVVSYPNRGCFVAEMSPEEAEEILVLRGGLEGLAARLAVDRMSRLDLHALDAVVARMERAAEMVPPDRAAFREADHEFHSAVVRHSGHNRLMRLWQSLDPLVWLRHIRQGATLPDSEYYRKVTREHRELLAVFASGDPARAQQAVWEHIVRRVPGDPARYLDAWSPLRNAVEVNR